MAHRQVDQSRICGRCAHWVMITKKHQGRCGAECPVWVCEGFESSADCRDNDSQAADCALFKEKDVLVEIAAMEKKKK